MYKIWGQLKSKKRRKWARHVHSSSKLHLFVNSVKNNFPLVLLVMVVHPWLGNCCSAYRVWNKLAKAQQHPFSIYVKIKMLSKLKKKGGGGAEFENCLVLELTRKIGSQPSYSYSKWSWQHGILLICRCHWFKMNHSFIMPFSNKHQRIRKQIIWFYRCKVYYTTPY